MALSIAVTARKLFNYVEKVTTGKLNAANFLTVQLSGAVSTSQIENRAVTTVKAEMGGPWFLGTDSGTATAHAVAIETALTDYADGMLVLYRPANNSNGSAITIRITGDAGAFATAVPLQTVMRTPPLVGELKVDDEVFARYNAAEGVFTILSANHSRIVQRGNIEGSSTADALVIEMPTDEVGWATLSEAVGRFLLVSASAENTGAMTLDYLGVGAKALRTPDDAAITAGQVVAGMQLLLTYNTAMNSAAGAWVVLNPLVQPDARVITSVRQTVLSGPVDSNGHPVLLTYSGQAVTLKATTSDPLVVVLAAGFDVSGAVDYVHRLTADAASAWTIPTSNATYYLFVDRDSSTGAITYGYTTSQPSYVNDDAASISSGAHTFLINRMKMYLGDGAAAAEKQRVFLGEALVSGSVITSVTSYMFKGEFQSPTDTAISALASNQAFTDSHKLGLMPASMECVLVAQGSTLNYVAGDEVDVQGITNSSYAYRYDHTWKSLTQLGWNYIAATYGAPYIVNKTSMGAPSAISAAGDFKVRFRASRGW